MIMAASNVLGSALKSGSGGAAGPSRADGTVATELVFDNSGWNVAFRGAEIDAPSSKNTDQGGAMGSGDLTQYFPFFAVAMGAILLWKITKSK